jgi:hypothetical protein
LLRCGCRARLSAAAAEDSIRGVRVRVDATVVLGCGATRATVEDSLHSHADVQEEMGGGDVVAWPLWSVEAGRRSRLSRGVNNTRKKKQGQSISFSTH